MNAVEGDWTGAVRRSIFVVTAPGLEELTMREMSRLGIAAAVDDGGIACDATLGEMYAANLHLRIATRVLLRVAEFRARSFIELERHARRIPWLDYLGGGVPARLSVTSRKSKLYHQRAIEQRFQSAIMEASGGRAGFHDAENARRDAGAPLAGISGEGRGEASDDVDRHGEQLFVVRFLHDRCTVSADTSGALLHLRGYRQAIARAPVRETLAVALLEGSGWNGVAPLIDPLCGSGTIPIEAALIARRIAPGLAMADRKPRPFAFQNWPGFDRRLWQGLVDRAREEILPRAPGKILGSDRDTGAIEAASANAERAGVAGDLELGVSPISAIPTLDAGGWLVTNPPYGMRVGESDRLRDLYAALGTVAHRAIPGGTVAILSADQRLDRQAGLPFREVATTRNGGIPVRIEVAAVPAG